VVKSGKKWYHLEQKNQKTTYTNPLTYFNTMKTIEISIMWLKFVPLKINGKKCKDMSKAIEYVRGLKLPCVRLRQTSVGGSVDEWDNF
jgi:hypothetical protein